VYVAATTNKSTTTTKNHQEDEEEETPRILLRLFPTLYLNTYLQLPDSRTPRHQEHDTLPTGQVCIHKHPHRGPLGRHANEKIDEFEFNPEIRTRRNPWMGRTGVDDG